MESKALRTWTQNSASPARRDAWLAIKRGLRCRCPNCGEGKLFRAFLKVTEACPACGEDLHHHRADDLPAYLVIVIVGHIVVPIALSIETNFAPPVALQLAIYLPLTFAASLLLLQPVKGAVVGLQWAFRMHGFDENSTDDMPVRDLAGGKIAPEVR
ncbi:MAG: hypothetical protein BGP05_22385 [Rhizobiales bacterium 62-47]|nr:DUF983 domain-containing protein [Hyphomicrobiales bacterium]OJY10408.1 MAG: hypothetical protein BGP05_22385 [Rhizobiales bacterium 62-47]